MLTFIWLNILYITEQQKQDGTARFTFFTEETKTIRLSSDRTAECRHDYGVCFQFPLNWLPVRVWWVVALEKKKKVKTNFVETDFIFFSCDNSVELEMSQGILKTSNGACWLLTWPPPSPPLHQCMWTCHPNFYTNVNLVVCGNVKCQHYILVTRLDRQ